MFQAKTEEPRIDNRKPLNASLDQVLAVEHGLGMASPVTSISLSNGTPWCAPGEEPFSGVSNNHLLVSIAQAFGVMLDEFGTQPEPKHVSGALREL